MRTPSWMRTNPRWLGRPDPQARCSLGNSVRHTEGWTQAEDKNTRGQRTAGPGACREITQVPEALTTPSHSCAHFGMDKLSPLQAATELETTLSLST